MVHGGIRHLEKSNGSSIELETVHGGIRHLENYIFMRANIIRVHGGIRHLESRFDRSQSTD